MFSPKQNHPLSHKSDNHGKKPRNHKISYPKLTNENSGNIQQKQSTLLIFCFCFIKIKKEQKNKENISGKNAFTCFFSLSLSIDNKTETSDGEARRNHIIPTG